MMARTSPLRMSNETSRRARTPPNDSDTFSTESSTSPAAMSDPGALMGGPRRRRSRRLLHRTLDRQRRHVPDLHARRNDALAAVLEGDLGRDVRLVRTVVKRVDQRRIALGDEAAPDLLRPRQFAVVGVKLLVQDQEPLDLRAGHHLVGDQRPVYLLDVSR